MRSKPIAARDIRAHSARRWEPELGMIFSLRDGFVWATWTEAEVAVRLGRHELVANTMRDFLAQDAVGERLNNHKPREH